MKTILMICPFAKPNIGGVESHLEKLMNYLSKRSCKVILVTYQPLTTKAKGERYEKNGDIEIFRTSWFGKGWFPKLEPYFPLVFVYLFPGIFLKSLFLYLRRHKEIDVIHAHGFIAAAIAKLLSLIHKKRTVVSIHAMYNFNNRRLLGKIIKWLLADFSKILATGEPCKGELLSIGIESKTVEVDPNWIDVDFFKPYDKITSKKILGINTTNFTVLFLGRLLEKKGVKLLIEAAKAANNGIDFVFIGDGPLAEMVKYNSSIYQNILFIGKIPKTLLPKYYSAADIFIAPALYDEGAATVYLESLSCGTYVIAGNKGCPQYFLSSEVADIIEPTVELITKRVSYWYSNRIKLNDISKICRDYALENFSEKNARIIEDSYWQEEKGQ